MGVRAVLAVMLALCACDVRTGSRLPDDDVTEGCGDGTVDADEVCDDGNRLDGDGCNASCSSDESCGNGVLDIGEACDDSNQAAADGCSADCTSDETCGNSIVDPGETCDDGNTSGADACPANCSAAPVSYVLADNTCTDNGAGAFNCSSSQLIGLIFDCGDGTHPYNNGCQGTLMGWRWTDTTPFQPSRIEVEYNLAIICQITNIVTSLNNVPSGTFTTPENLNGCVCVPTAVPDKWTLTGAQLDGFVRGGVNELTFPSFGTPGTNDNCFGVSSSPELGGFVKITVFP
jgi:cysteine-rich repeat protein